MLSKNQMVAVRKAIELTYDCTCDVIEYKKVKKENKSTGFQEEKVLENVKCKLSFESIAITNQDDVSSKVVQSTKLFIAPEHEITPGSKISVTNKQGVTTEYKSSGKPAKYETHQEIMLELFKEWT